MKKIVCLLVALMLCLSSAAFAESVPSKTTGDLTKFEVETDNMADDSGFFIRPVVENEEAYQRHVEVCQTELGILMSSEAISAYFGEVTDFEGNVISLAEVLDAETLNVYEFCPLIAGEYEEHFGKVTMKMLFSTPYEKNEKVIIMIGIVTVNEDGTQTVAWTAYEGVGVEIVNASVEEQGCIQVELDPEIVLAIQEGITLLAVVSK